MAEERRYSSRESGNSRQAASRQAGAQRPASPRASANTHSSYEEAIRRSNERLNNVQRGAKRLSEMQHEDLGNGDFGRPARSSVSRSAERAPRPGRKTVRLSDHGEFDDIPPAPQRQAPVQPYAPADTGQQRGIHLPNPFSRGQQDGAYRSQLQGQARGAGGYQPKQSPFSMPSLPSMPVPRSAPNSMLVRVVICVVLLLVVVFSFTRIGPAASALGEAQANVQTHQEELDNANKANDDLQAQLDSMQTTIDKYNDLVNASS